MTAGSGGVAKRANAWEGVHVSPLHSFGHSASRGQLRLEGEGGDAAPAWAPRRGACDPRDPPERRARPRAARCAIPIAVGV